MWFSKLKTATLTTKIIVAMLLGMATGLILNFFELPVFVEDYLISGLLEIGGTLFVTVLTMLVVPTVFVSIICGTCSINDSSSFGRVISKTLVLYLLTTILGIVIALFIATLLQLGKGHVLIVNVDFNPLPPPSFKETLTNLIPSNPIAAMSEGNMIQVIVFAILVGLAIVAAKEPGQKIANIFQDFNTVIIELIHLIMRVAPYGVFCLIANQFAKMGIEIMLPLIGYLLTTLGLLILHFFVINGLLISYLAKLNPLIFFRKFYAAALFAFSTSSSSASIPVVLDTVTTKLGVKNSIAAFAIPLGATINMSGTAIMQAATTVFLANLYNIELGLSGYFTVITIATLAAIGTAGVPGVGTIMLAMVLGQIGIPIEGIGIIFGVERLLDMARTTVNVSGDAVVACIVAKSENAIDEEKYYDMDAN